MRHGILFDEAADWYVPNAGVVRNDLSPKPAYLELKKLIKGEWWTGEKQVTPDAAGRLAFRGFLGQYELQMPGKTTRFSLDGAGRQSITVRFPRP